jgi:hypothetical protein
MRLYFLTALMVCLSSAHAAAPGMTVTFVARGPQSIVKDTTDTVLGTGTGKHEFSAAGHAYIIIGVPTNSGIKEEVYGFYPQDNSPKGIIKGPGMMRSDLRCAPQDDCSKDNYIHLKRLSETDKSVQIGITPEQYKIVQNDIAKWDGDAYSDKSGAKHPAGEVQQYNLFNQNCVNFISDVAKDLGYSVPPAQVAGLLPNQTPITPVDFLRHLEPLIKEQERASELAQKALDEKRVRDEQMRVEEQRKLEEKALLEKQARADEQAKLDQAKRIERQRQIAAENERNSIPAGWVPCSCPAQHGRFGKFVHGVLYHPDNLKCQ